MRRTNFATITGGTALATDLCFPWSAQCSCNGEPVDPHERTALTVQHVGRREQAALLVDLQGLPRIGHAGGEDVPDELGILRVGRACQVVCVSDLEKGPLEVVGEAVGVGEGECSQGLFPALDDGSLDELGRGFALVGRESAFLDALAGAFVLDVPDGQPEQLDGGVVIGEVAAVLDDLSELIVQALDRVRGVDEFP